MTSTKPDQVPDERPQSFSMRTRNPNVPPSDNVFPFRLYQGPLTNGADALVISPSIWEFDGDNVNDYYMLWSQHQNELNGTLYYEPQVHAMIEGKTFGSFNLAGGMSFPQIPIGTNRDIAVGNFSQGTYSFSSSVADTVVVLTREIIEKELARPGPQTDGAAPNGATSVGTPGVMTIVFGGARLSYSMNIQVERQ
jgi:hypothetical protein